MIKKDREKQMKDIYIFRLHYFFYFYVFFMFTCLHSLHYFFLEVRKDFFKSVYFWRRWYQRISFLRV